MRREDEIAANLDGVEARIAAACSAAGRDRAEITLIVITKTCPASDIDILAGLGVTDVGENRHPEAQLKTDELRAMHPRRGGAMAPKLHFVGGLQTNKAKAVARYVDVIHSVDRLKLVAALDSGAVSAGRTIECLVQVGLSQDAGRSGADQLDVADIAEAIDVSDRLILGGVMAVAPLGADPQKSFDELSAVAATLRRTYPKATTISAGMSGDLEHAVKAGATHLRIGRSVLGERPSTG